MAGIGHAVEEHVARLGQHIVNIVGHDGGGHGLIAGCQSLGRADEIGFDIEYFLAICPYDLPQ